MGLSSQKSSKKSPPAAAFVNFYAFVYKTHQYHLFSKSGLLPVTTPTVAEKFLP
ncbi:MAG: hypothetical protein K0S33_1488 [Bacteroidetes bacterium]|jgi:hypothetical protein|nr:hypothetical protein [Bacteroidota bacterium]